MNRLRRVATLVGLLLSASAARAQPPALAEPAALRGESPQTRKRLAEAEQKVLGGKAADAIDDLQRILDEAGDDLISIDGKHHRAARWVAHQILAKLPADALKTYRDRIDEPARKLLEAGKRDRDMRPLRQLLDRFFVSRPAEEGSLLLGDLLFERGEFRTAELTWRRLLPDAEVDVSFPAPKLDLAAARARVVLAAAFQGERNRAQAELTAFQTKHPGATGALVGKTGPYAETLQAYIDRPPQPGREPAVRTWPTFAGDAARTGRVPGPMPLYWPTRPTWTATIPPEFNAIRVGSITPPGRPPFGHPVVADGHVYVTDGSRIFAFELTTGRVWSVHPLFEGSKEDKRVEKGGKSFDPTACPSLTAAHGRLYARTGPAVVRAPDPAQLGDSAIRCFAAPDKRGKNTPPLRELWHVKPPVADGKAPGVWEGAPLVADGRMWAAFARFEGGRVVHAIAAFDPADSDKAPERPTWIAEVSDSPLSSGSDSRVRQELLALAGRNIVLSTNAGAVIAVDALTGHRAWGFQYPRTIRRAAEASRSPEPAPAVAAGGRVFVAAADADRVYALDSETGELLWETGTTEGAQIVGVTRNRVVITTTGPVRGIRALNVVTGSYREPEGWIQADGGGVLSYGRGIATDDLIVWPSRAGLYFLNPDTGRPWNDPLRTMSPEPLDTLFGNVVYADGWMVVVGASQVWAYEADAPPFVRPGLDADPRTRFETLIDRSDWELADGRGPAARQTLIAAIRADFPRAWRAWAAARLLLLAPPTDDLRELLTPELLGEWLLTSEGELVSLGTLVDRRAGRPAPPRGSPASPTLPADRKPPEAPSLRADARIDYTLRLPPNAIPLRPIPGASGPPKHLFVATPSEVLAIALDGAEQTRHTAVNAFTHAVDLPGGFLAAGPFAIALYRDARDPSWVFRVPETDPLPCEGPSRTVRAGERPPRPELSSFNLTGDWLVARLGEHHLIAFDLKAHRVAWILGAHGRPRFEPILVPSTPRFAPQFLVAERLIVVQLSDRRRWMVRASTGRVWGDDGKTFVRTVPPEYGSKTAAVPWSLPPVEVEDNCLAASDGPGLVRFVNLASGRVKFTYEVEGESSLAGDPPQVRIWGDAALVAIRRNHGVELDRIDLDDGKPAWTGGAAFLETSRIDLSKADADALRAYLPVGNKLVALALDDGKPAWEADLSVAASGWVVRAGRKAIIAYPVEAVPDEPFSATWTRVRQSFPRTPLPWRLPGLMTTLYDSWTDRTVPVLLFDPETGKLLKRLSVPARGPCVAARFEGDLAVVATGDRVVWLR